MSPREKQVLNQNKDNKITVFNYFRGLLGYKEMERDISSFPSSKSGMFFFTENGNSHIKTAKNKGQEIAILEARLFPCLCGAEVCIVFFLARMPVVYKKEQTTPGVWKSEF